MSLGHHKRRRSLSCDLAEPTDKRRAIASWLQQASAGSSEVFQPEVEPSETWNPSDDDDLSIAPSNSSSNARESEKRIDPTEIDYEPILSILGVRNADSEPTGKIPQPWNWGELQSVIRRARDSPKASSDEEEEMRLGIHNLSNEGQFMHAARKLMRSSWVTDREMTTQPKLQWERFVPLDPNGKPQLSAPCPDISYGWQPAVFGDIEYQIIASEPPKTGKYDRSFEAPHPAMYWPFATGEVKGHRRTFDECRLRNAYSGAVMVRNRLHLQSLIAGMEVQYNRAMIFTFEITPILVSVCCHWASQESGRTIYWARQLDSWSLHNIPQDGHFHTARRAIRNLVEHGRASSFAELKAQIAALQVLLWTESTPTTITPI